MNWEIAQAIRKNDILLWTDIDSGSSEFKKFTLMGNAYELISGIDDDYQNVQLVVKKSLKYIEPGFLNGKTLIVLEKPRVSSSGWSILALADGITIRVSSNFLDHLSFVSFGEDTP